jgi:hypothetical protein
MAKSKPLSRPEATLEELLDKVSNAREELVAVERTLERLRADITKSQKQKSGSGSRQSLDSLLAEFQNPGVMMTSQIPAACGRQVGPIIVAA